MVIRLICLALFSSTVLSACTTNQNPPKQEARSHYLLGASALSENNPTKALQEFLLAEKADSRDADIQAGLAQAYWQKRAHDLAEKHFKKAIKLSDGAPQHHYNLAALYLTMDRHDESITEFRKAAENLLFPTPEGAWTGVGYAYYLKHDYAAAERYYLKARELNSRYDQASFRLGELYYSQDRVVEAVEAFSRAIELAPRSALGHYWLGMAAMKTRDSALARKAFQETIRLAPESEQARLARNYLKTLQ